MNLSSLTGGNPPEKGLALQYTAQVASPLINGEAKLTIDENALIISSLFDTAAIPFVEINILALADYVITVRADSGNYTLSKLGNWCQPFYDALREAYNKAVLRALFVSGPPIITAKGDYHYSENGTNISGSASIHVYENSVVALPPNANARRVPLCFTTVMDKGDYELTLTLDTGEIYTYAKLGYDTAPFATAVETQIRALREKSLTAIREIDPTLTTAQSSQIAKLMPQGAAAQIGKLIAIAPSFVTALECKIADTRTAESYKAFKELCDPAQIHVGFRKNDVPAGSANGLPHPNGNTEGEESIPDPCLLWLIAPSPDGRHAAVEFATSDSATFVYRTNGDFPAFARQLNHALEAINFKREVIRLTDDELRKPENTDYYMASKLTAALRLVRTNFAGRVIHSGIDAWKRKLTELW